MNHRLGIIDALRGLAIIGMVLFHANYMLVFLFERDVFNAFPLFWFILGRIVATLFIGLAGISFFLSSQHRSGFSLWKKTLQRAGLLGFLALGISLVTYTFFPDQQISWGIIHFFALSTLLAPCFRIFGRGIFCIGLIILIFPYIWTPDWQSIFLIPIGFPPYNYFSADYYPIFPWFGIYLMGYAFADFLSRRGLLESVFSLKKERYRVLTYIGRHSLSIYMVHVPILYLCFSLVL